MTISPFILIRLESLLFFVILLITYQQLNASWLTFIIIFFIPDVSILSYLINRSIGALIYNLIHSYIIPMVILFILWLLAFNWLFLPIIWLSHIAFDRSLGYGLKLNSGFRFTHLGKIGHDKSQ